MKKVKTVTNNGLFVAQFGSDMCQVASTNNYVKCFHINTDLFKTNTIKLQNHDAANTITWKLTGKIDRLQGAEETILVGDLNPSTNEKLIESANYSQYSCITLYVKSKIEDSHGNYTWEFFTTVN